MYVMDDEGMCRFQMAASLWWDEPNSSSSRSNQDSRKQQEDLSVFGYACKLFRDDERAREIDQGKLLIPWMGNESLMIDRSVVRSRFLLDSFSRLLYFCRIVDLVMT